jgi:hypothetical protein
LSGAFSSSAFDTNAFSVLAWDFGTTPPPVVVRGGHFGKKRHEEHREREFSDELEAKQRLRQQIVEAMDGPHAEVIEEVLSDYIAPEKAYLPPIQRMQWDKIYRQLDHVEMALLLHLSIAEDDDDEDWLLLNG